MGILKKYKFNTGIIADLLAFSINNPEYILPYLDLPTVKHNPISPYLIKHVHDARTCKILHKLNIYSISMVKVKPNIYTYKFYNNAKGEISIDIKRNTTLTRSFKLALIQYIKLIELE